MAVWLQGKGSDKVKTPPKLREVGFVFQFKNLNLPKKAFVKTLRILRL